MVISRNSNGRLLNCAWVLVVLLWAAAGRTHAAALFTNLIVNGDAEAGPGAADFESVSLPPGWTLHSGNFTALQYVTGGPSDINPVHSATIGGGANFFAGGPELGDSRVYQVIDVTDLASVIDAGGITAHLSAYLGGWTNNNDSITVFVTFYDEGLNSLGPIILPTVFAPERGNISLLLFKEANQLVPVNTRFIEVEMFADRTDGSYNDGYADNLSLVLLPEPTTAACLIMLAAPLLKRRV